MLLSFIVPAIESLTVGSAVLSLSCTEANPLSFFVRATGSVTVSPGLPLTLPIVSCVSGSGATASSTVIEPSIPSITRFSPAAFVPSRA